MKTHLINDLNGFGITSDDYHAFFEARVKAIHAFCLADLVNTEGRNLKFIPLAEELKIEAYIVTKKYAYFSKAAKLLLTRLREQYQ